MKHMGNICAPDAPGKPDITAGIDIPFSESGTTITQDIPSLIKLKDQEHTHDVENLKNTIGKKLLYGCLVVVIAFAVADAIWHIDSPMFTSAFEVVKIVATTVLGYLFGSKSKS